MFQFKFCFSVARKIVVNKSFFGSVLYVLPSPFNNDAFFKWRMVVMFKFQKMADLRWIAYVLSPYFVETGCWADSFRRLADRNRLTTINIFLSLF